jgi:hypothetical protein
MFTRIQSRLVRALAVSAALTTFGAGTAMAGPSAPPRPYRTLHFTTFVDHFPIDITLDLAVEGTPPRPGREEERVLFMSKGEAAKAALQFVLDWIDPDVQATPPANSGCTIHGDVQGNGNLTINHIECNSPAPAQH